jgi:WS/DGAT/MGAT family acyltransferase
VVAARLHEVPSFRWRLAEVPFGLHHPVWIEDPDFDLGYHIRETTLPAPGGTAEVEALVADLLPELFDLRHPLWQVMLVHGLAGDRQALILRFHHSIADGAALITTLDALFSPVSPDASPPPEPEEPPRPRALVGQALKEQAHNWAEAPRLLRTTLARFKSVEQRREDAPVVVPRAMGDAPGSILNDSWDDRRTYARLVLPTATLQRVKSRAGCTLNDVVLAVVAGGLRTYLGARDALPEAPLVANVPVANDPPGSPPRQHGNLFANFFTSLATDVADPAERLAAIAAGTVEAKHQLDLQGRDTLPAWLDRLPPAIARPAAKTLAKRKHGRTEVADFNVLVSNVRVTATHWAVEGAPVDRIFMSGPVADGAGLNVTITGFGSDLHIALVANPASVDDPHELADAMVAALDELEVATCTA